MKTMCGIGFLLIALTASAIVVDDYSVATNAPSGAWDLNWDYVYPYKRSSSVAVGECWLLTAAHVADDSKTSTVVIDGTSYYQQEIVFHDEADLALVRFDKSFPGFYGLYSGILFASSELIMVGFGNTGMVVDESGGGPFAPHDYYTDSGSGRGIKRWGTQRYSLLEILSYDAGGGTKTSTGFWMDFTVGDTPYEAGVGVYDSGGGTFADDGGIWTLAGINVTRSQNESGYTSTFAISIPAYETWITETMDSVTGDDDSDGLPNWWEEQYGTNVLASFDQDGDGFTGEEEYIADTDPTDDSSFFFVEGGLLPANQTFTFYGSTARQYQMLYTTNDLADPGLVWVTNGTPVWGEGGNTVFAATNTEKMVYYRINAILP